MRLKSDKHFPYLGNASQLRHGIAHGVIFQSQQAGQFFLIQFADTLINIVTQHKGKKLLLFVGVASEYKIFVIIDALPNNSSIIF